MIQAVSHRHEELKMPPKGKLPEAEAQLKGLIGATKDRDLLALAYNVLGDCYRLNGQAKDALGPDTAARFYETESQLLSLTDLQNSSKLPVE